MRRPDGPGTGGRGAGGASPCELLAVSFAYPPSALPRAVQVMRLLKNLGTRTTLVCADHEEKRVRKDPTLVAEAESFLAHCLRVPFAPRGWRGLISRAAYRFDLPAIDKTPDHFRPWKPAVMRAVAAFARERGYAPDVLASFGFPMSDHLIGLALKRRLRVPWVAHFSDPWVDNPFTRHDPLTRRLNLSLEGKVLAAADRLVFTSRETLELVMSKYPRGLKAKARVVAHAYDPEQFPAREGAAGGPLVIRYLGDLYNHRSPEPLFRALAHTLSERPQLLSGVRFEIVGSTYELDLGAMGLNALPEGMVAVKPSVKYLDSLTLMAGADGLLVIDAPAEVSVFLPSKLIDYVGAGRPVLGITPPGTAADLIRRLGGWVADPSDVPAVAAALQTFVAYLRERQGAREPWGDAGVRRGFAVATVSREFEGILEELLGRPVVGTREAARLSPEGFSRRGDS